MSELIGPVFSWKANPEIADLVWSNYHEVGAADLARDIAEAHGVFLQPASIRSYYRHRKNRQTLSEQGISAEQMPEPTADLPEAGTRRPDQNKVVGWSEIEEMFDAATADNERRNAHRLAQTSLTVNFGDSLLPRAVCYWSDWQVGSNGVMMERLKRDAKTIAETEGLETFVLGDLIHNLNRVKHPQSLHECVLPDPRDQALCAKYVLNLAKEKIQGFVDGNHERNSKDAAGLVPSEEWCKEFGFPYLWYGARVKYQVGGITYTMALQHRFRGESAISTTNAQRRIYHEYYPADIVVLGDKHYPDMQKRPAVMGDTVWLRAGTYQRDDDYGQFAGGYKGGWGIPVVVLLPDKKKVVPFHGTDFHLALEFLADQRERYRKKLAQN